MPCLPKETLELAAQVNGALASSVWIVGHSERTPDGRQNSSRGVAETFGFATNRQPLDLLGFERCENVLRYARAGRQVSATARSRQLSPEIRAQLSGRARPVIEWKTSTAGYLPSIGGNRVASSSPADH